MFKADQQEARKRLSARIHPGRSFPPGLAGTQYRQTECHAAREEYHLRSIMTVSARASCVGARRCRRGGRTKGKSGHGKGGWAKYAPGAVSEHTVATLDGRKYQA